MRLSDVAVRRPVLATVLNVLILVLGLAAFPALPIRHYPDVELPVVSISAVWFGASPETVETSLTEPLEQGLSGIEGIKSVSSSSAFSTSMINIEFEAGRDLDVAASDVSNAVQAVVGQLPPEAEPPVISKAFSGGTSALSWNAVSADDSWTAVDLTDLVDRMVKTPLQLIPGVARVMMVGGRRYAMRVWLDPARMASRGVEPADVRRAIRENNLQVPAGRVEGSGRRFTVNVDAQLADPKLFERLVIRREGDSVVRIEDVGWVEVGASNYDSVTRVDGRQTVGFGIIPLSTANQLEVSARVTEALAEIEAGLPEGMEITTAVDSSLFVRASLRQAAQTLVLVFIIVMLVNLLFLRSPVSTMIAGVAVPVSLIGALAAMYVLGFSINVLTVLGLILAIGLLVDDSIVVLENIYRRQELGESRIRAALNGTREVAFPVIATTTALLAVLVPLASIPGNTGRLFREFAWTMAAAVVISTFVALTAVPMACSIFLRTKKQHGTLWKLIEGVLEGMTRGYRAALRFSLAHPWFVALFLVGTMAGTGFLFRTVPTTLTPSEDMGEVFTVIRAPQGSTAAYTDRALRQVEADLSTVPEVESVWAAIAMSMGGPADTSGGIVFVSLKPWDERERSAQEIVGELFPRFMAIPEALVFPMVPPSFGSPRTSDVEVAIKSTGATLEELQEVGDALLERVREIPGIVNPDTDLRLDNPQLDVDIDRETAADLGITAASVADAVRLLVSEGRADEFVLRSKQYDVVMALERDYSSMPQRLDEIHVRADDGSMVPLSAIVELRPSVAPASLNHFGLQRSTTLTANLMPGATLGDVMPQVLAAADEVLPEGFTTDLLGASREFVESGRAMYLTFGVALLIIFLVLSAQFESFLHPLTVMLSVPLALFGALLTLKLLGHSLNIYSAIGIVLLVGLVTKNSILLVDFANQARARGERLLPAVRLAGRTRFRPILMTSITSILGALPLMFATGAGAESRQPIGAAVMGGLLFSTVFTLLIVPAVYVWVVRLGQKLGVNTIPPEVVLETEIVPEEPGTSGLGDLTLAEEGSG